MNLILFVEINTVARIFKTSLTAADEVDYKYRKKEMYCNLGKKYESTKANGRHKINSYRYSFLLNIYLIK